MRCVAIALATAARLLMRGSPRTRMAVGLAALVVIASSTASVAPSLSGAAQGLAVLLLAAGGIWMMLASSVR